MNSLKEAEWSKLRIRIRKADLLDRDDRRQLSKELTISEDRDRGRREGEEKRRKREGGERKKDKTREGNRQKEGSDW